MSTRNIHLTNPFDGEILLSVFTHLGMEVYRLIAVREKLKIAGGFSEPCGPL